MWYQTSTDKDYARFLLARLHLDSLLDKKTKKKAVSTLENLSKGSAALNDAYSDAIKRIDSQLAEDAALARSVLAWLTYAERQLTTGELCEALAVERGDTDLDQHNIPDVEDLISVCAGLVTVDEESNIIRLIHYTTQDFFANIFCEWIPNAQEEIAMTCLTYLSFTTFRSGSCANDEEFKDRIMNNVFFKYAASYLGQHIRSAEEQVCEAAFAFFQNDTLISSIVQVLFGFPFHSKSVIQKFYIQRTGLHLAGSLGLPFVSNMLLVARNGDKPAAVNSKDSWSETALSLAARGGHEAVVRMLLDRDDIKADSKNFVLRTPLSLAAFQKHEAVVRILLNRIDVNVNSKDTWGRTPLSDAAQEGHEAMIRMLLTRDDVEPDSNDLWGRTPLSYAAQKGHEAVIRMLLARDDVEPNSKDSWDRTPLSYAAQKGHEAVIRMLLARDDVEPNSKDSWDRTSLSYAAQEGHEAVLRMLLARDDIEADSKDNNGQSPLSYAAGGGYEEMVRILLDREVEINSKDKNGWTPLFFAANCGREAIVKILLNREIEVNCKDQKGRTSLHVAAKQGHEKVLRILLDQNVEVDLKDHCGRTALLAAALAGKEEAVELLLRNGADPEVTCDSGIWSIAFGEVEEDEKAGDIVSLFLDTKRVCPPYDRKLVSISDRETEWKGRPLQWGVLKGRINVNYFYKGNRRS